MDSSVQGALNIPSEVSKLLVNCGATTLGVPKWSIRVTDSKIYLDLAWTKDSHCVVFPAKNQVNEPSNTALEIPTVKKIRRKRKSPSTQRRDQQRLQRWKIKKGLNQDHPMTEQTHTEPVEAKGACSSAAHILNRQCENTARTQTVNISVPSDKEVASKLVLDAERSIAVALDTGSGDEEPFSDTYSEHSSDSEPPCPVCSNCGIHEYAMFEPLKKCTRCKVAQYCTRECQAQDWPEHKKHCAPDLREQLLK